MLIPDSWRSLIHAPFKVISVDLCPRYNNRRTYAGTAAGKEPVYLGASDHYETHEIDEMCAWGDLVRPVLADVAVALFWVTKPRIRDYFAVMDAWGFKPITCMYTWLKADPKHWEEFEKILTQGSLLGGNVLELMEDRHYRPYDEPGEIVRPLFRWLLSKLGGHWSQSNSEDVWVAVYKAKGHKSDTLSSHGLLPSTLTYQPIITPRSKIHSRKPEEMQSRMEIAWSGVSGPWLEIAATRERDDIELPGSHLRKRWICLGNHKDLNHPMQFEESLPLIAREVKKWRQ